MNTLLRMYPGDACAFLIARVVVQVTVVILTAWLLARLGSRWNAAWRHSIYLFALICVLACPALSWVLQTTDILLVSLRPSMPTTPPAEAARAPVALIPEATLTPTAATPHVLTNRVHLDAENPGQLTENQPSRSFSDILRALGGLALVIWLLAVALLSARWCYGLRLIATLRRAAQPFQPGALAELLPQVRRALGVEKLPPMATSAALDRPIMVGLIRPLVILPENMLRTLHGPELADILVHECAHAVCRHQVIALLQRAAGILFWPHPLVHRLNRELARAREEVCDNYVLRRSDARRYARTLFELSQSLVGVSLNSTAIGLFHCHWRLEDRIADLLDQRRRVMIRVDRWTAVALTAAFLLPALLIAGTRVVQAEADATAPAAATITEIKPLDLLTIRADGTLTVDPIDGTYLVEPDGRVSLGASYGRVDISGLSLEQAEAKILKQLKDVLENPQVQVTAAGKVSRWRQAVPPKTPSSIIPGDLLFVCADGTLLSDPVQGFYRVEPTGTVALGPVYGRVQVQGLTQEAAAKAIEKKLTEVLIRPRVQVITAQLREATPPEAPYAIRAGDVLSLNIVFYLDKGGSLHGVRAVEPDGTVLVSPNYGRIEVQGLSLESAERAIREHLKKFVTENVKKPADLPWVSVTLAGWKIGDGSL